LQIENEFYSSVRPKRVALSGERPTAALERGGIEYVEIRALDINLFDPCGINQNAMRFMEALLIYCLLADSPTLSDDGLHEAANNQTGTAKYGRDPDFRLVRGGKRVSVSEWAHEIVDGVLAVATELDRHDDNDSYSEAVRLMQNLIDEPDATPSARIIAEIQSANTSFFSFALSLAQSHRDYFASITQPDDASNERLRREALESLQRQKEIEEADVIGLDEYLQEYFA
jgi:glutamate--cysteine ligase